MLTETISGAIAGLKRALDGRNEELHRLRKRSREYDSLLAELSALRDECASKRMPRPNRHLVGNYDDMRRAAENGAAYAIARKLDDLVGRYQ